MLSLEQGIVQTEEHVTALHSVTLFYQDLSHPTTHLRRDAGLGGFDNPGGLEGGAGRGACQGTAPGNSQREQQDKDQGN